MSRTRTLIIALALAAVLPAGLAQLTGCEKSPDEPVFENPFDPDGPLAGDGLQVNATAIINVVVVKWDHHPGKNIAMYAVDHRTDLDTEWSALADTILEADDMESVSYIHLDADPNRTHMYMVQALTTDGDYTLTGYASPASATTPPIVFHDANQGKVASRYLSLKIVTGEGDSIRVADNPEFTDALELPAAAPADTALATWDFGPHATDDSVAVHVQSFTSGSYASEVFSASMTVSFEPEFGIVGGVESGVSIKVPAVVNDLRVDDRGVEQMRFAWSEEDLPLASWVPGDTIYADFALQPITGVQSIWGEFQGDFGFGYTGRIRVRGDLLEDASFSLDLPRNLVTTHTRVGVENDAAASEMRFTDSPDFTSVPWRPFAVTDSVDFTGTPGPVIIYGQFRNDWTDSPVLTDSLVFALLPLDVYFVTPPGGAVIDGGTTYEVTGRAIAADGASLRTLEVDTGNGWSVIPPAQDWTTDWIVPAVTASAEALLRVRATTAADTATAAISVTVVPGAR